MRQTLYSVALAKPTIVPAGARTTTTTGTTVDRMTDEGGFRSALVVVSTGTITDGTHTVEVQDSDNGSSWAAVADEFLQGSEPAIGASHDDTVFEVGYTGHRRYLRVVITVSGTPATGGIYGAVILLGWPRKMPPARV
ncbi:hypothetical protein [Streptomyces capitiformicae]|uniref:Uncharacterized protein n=1 Tax=Streptomyces capitiformicae TaxID=2014920 RepID=A0A919GNF2_9ACTN|nr:hypothetical protein [Streptomyces capitiformicae]GHH87818.1 hypothetical protein GCM10017771_30490 [Streptomyces capitiformicae]